MQQQEKLLDIWTKANQTEKNQKNLPKNQNKKKTPKTKINKHTKKKGTCGLWTVLHCNSYDITSLGQCKQWLGINYITGNSPLPKTFFCSFQWKPSLVPQQGVILPDYLKCKKRRPLHQFSLWKMSTSGYPCCPLLKPLTSLTPCRTEMPKL